MSNRIAALDGGASYHINALNDPAWADLITARPYLPDLADTDLTAFDIVIVTCRCRSDLLAAHRDQLNAYVRQGGWLIASGATHAHEWLDRVEHIPAVMNYWWWLDEVPDHGMTITAPEHPIAQLIPLDDMVWHHHDRFRPPPGAVSVLEAREGGTVIYDHAPETGGRTLVMSVDPFFHHGSFFMPAATRFLQRFMPWLATAPLRL